MKKFLQMIVAAALFLPYGTANAQQTVSGVTMPAAMKIVDTDLQLNGAGLREKMWIDLYVGGLYIPQKTKDANKVINADEVQVMKLHIVSSMITKEKMVSAVDDGFKKSLNGNTTPMIAEITKFKGFFSEDIKVNDVFDIVYIPGRGTLVYKNGDVKGLIKGLEFKKALFGIWFGDEPADAALKKGMLGN